MELRLGSTVITSDGKEIGKVDRLVLDPETREITEAIVHKGFLLTEDRIVPMSSVRGVDSDGAVHLTTTSDAIDQLPLFVERAYYIPTEDEYSTLPYATHGFMAAPGVASPLLWGAPPAGRPLMDPTPVEPEPLVDASVGEDTVVIDKGTNVLDRHGESVGHVEDVQYDSFGRMTSIIVKSGLIRKHEYRVPAHRIEKLLDSEVWLTVRGEELAEHQG